MKFLLSLACMCLFLFVGSVLSVQSQPESDILYCDNGECETLVAEIGEGWVQAINCGGKTHIFTGTGPYEGSVCGMTMD